MSSLMARMPDELLARCAGWLDTPTARRLAQVSRAGERLVLARLELQRRPGVLLKRQLSWPHRGRTRAARCTHRPAWAFIDTFAHMWEAASSGKRKHVVECIVSAASGVDHLGSTQWTASVVCNRLKKVGIAF
jgi:hypothetical protein